MKSGILIVLVVTVFASGILAIPSELLNGKPTRDILTKPKARGVSSPDYDFLFEQYTTSINGAYRVLIPNAQNEVHNLLKDSKVLDRVNDISNKAQYEMGKMVVETYYTLSPNDTLEDTALLIDVTVVRSTLLLVKYGKAAEEIVAKDAAELLPSLKSINKRVALDVETQIEPLVASLREILP